MKYPVNANRKLKGYEDFYRFLMDASYCYADDSGKEWPQGTAFIDKAADVVISNKWQFWQIEQAHKAAQPLITLDQIVSRVLSILYYHSDELEEFKC